MNRYYMNFGTTAAQYVRELFPSAKNAEERCVADLTSDGTLVKFVPLPPNEAGPRIGIYGKTCYAEAGPERSRDDTLFVFRVSRRQNLAAAEHSSHAGNYSWLAWRDMEQLDFVRPVFFVLGVARTAASRGTPILRAPAPAAAARVRKPDTVSSDLCALLAKAQPDLRAAFHPKSPPTQLSLEDLRALWQRLVENTRRPPAAPIRDDRILDGTITPSATSDESLEGLRQFFEHTFFSQVVEPDLSNPPRVLVRVGEFCRSGLASPQTLAQLWLASTSTVLPNELKAELITLSSALPQLSSAELQRQWWDVICSSVYRLRDSQRDTYASPEQIDELLDMLAEVDDADADDVEAFCDWARRHEPQVEPAQEQPSEGALIPLMRASEPSIASVRPWPELSKLEEHALHDWLLALRGVSRPALAALREQVASVARRADELANSLETIEGMLTAPELGRVLRDMLEQHQDVFTEQSAKELASLRGDALGAMRNASRHVDVEAIADVVQRRAVKPSDLEEAATLFEQRHLWQHLPSWWWHQAHEQAGSSAWSAPPTNANYLELFCSAPARNATRTACERLSEIDASNLPVLAELPAPPKGTTGAAHLAAELQRFTLAFQLARNKYRGSISTLLDRGVLGRDEFLDIAERFDQLERRVSQAAFELILTDLVGCERAEQARGYMRAVERALEQLAEANAGPDASKDERNEITRELGGLLIVRRTKMIHSAGHSPTEREPPSLALKTLDVGTPDDPTDRPPLLFVPSNSNAQAAYGSANVPLVIRTKRARSMSVTIRLADDASVLRTRWPSDGAWGSAEIEPGSIKVDESDWQKEGAEYELVLPISVPLRRPQPNGQSLVLTFEVQELANRSSPSVLKAEFKRWIVGDEGASSPLVAQWSTSENAQYAEDVPVGPQVHVSEILERIRSDNALAITAPRRFGKSSLIALLEKRIQAMPDTVAIRVDCSTHGSGETGQVEHTNLWMAVSDELKSHTEGVGLSWSDGQLTERTKPVPPRQEAFDNVRRQLARLGKARVVIFFDEAQRLFEANPAYGAKLRALIATHVGRRTKELAAVVFCFVGLPSMTPERLGADLYPLLNPLQHAELAPDQVARVIRKVTQGAMYTSRAARERIARSSWNLYALRTILDRLGRRLSSRRRVWASVEDVIEVESSLIQELRDGRDPEAIGTYIRDALNASVSPDEFIPVAAFPVAAAYALALDLNQGGRGAAEACERTLGEWSELFFRNQIARPSFKQDQVAAHLRELEEQRVLEPVNDVLGGYRFRSAFLGAFLVGQANRYLYSDRVLANSMLRTGLPRISLPSERQQVASGAQASVVRFRREQKDLAARLRELPTADEQQEFLESRSLLDLLRPLYDGNREGSESLYKLVEIGLLDDGSSAVIGAEVYHYIPGCSLATKAGQLSAALVAAIGLRLTKALRLIHEVDVLHRDIRPGNVILQENATTPVLIDFGLACSRSKPTHTPIDDEFTAPEVKGTNPKWSAAADVFSLAVTLRKLLLGTAKGLEKQLHDSLSKVASHSPEDRENIDVIARALDAVAADSRIEQRRRDFHDRIQELVDRDPQSGHLQWVLRNRCAPEVEGFALGLYTTDLERARCIASIVAKAVEKIEGMSVHDLMAKRSPARQMPGSVSSLVRARNEAAHGGAGRSTYSLHDIREGTRVVSNVLASPALSKLVEFLVAHH